MTKFWNLKTNNENTDAARLDLFGIIGADGFWEQGFDETSFKYDMESIPEDKALDIYINSDGGSVFTALAIYNMVKRHKGAVKITVAGLAASAATIITSVPNARVVMSAGSMMMVHAPSSYIGWANASQLRTLADTLDKVGGSIVDIYKQKTAQAEEKLVEMMSTETWLTASEAVELGFADEIDNSNPIAAVRNNGQLIVNGRAISEARLKHIPAAWTGESEKGVKSMKTFEEFKEKYPEFYNQAKEEGRVEGIDEGGKNERERIKAIEEISDEADELAFKAKYEEPMDAGAYAIAARKRDKEKGANFLNKRNQDAKGLDGIEPGSNAGNIQNKQGESDEDAIKRLSAVCKYKGGM